MFEEGLVELSAHPVRLPVGGVAVADAGECPLEVGLGCLVVGVDRGESALGGGDFGGDPGLLGLQEVEGDGVGVVGVEQLLAFGFELARAGGLGPSFAFGVGCGASSALRRERRGAGRARAWELDGGVVGGDGFFDVFDAERALSAAVRVLLAADADEVGVGAARPLAWLTISRLPHRPQQMLPLR